MDYKATLGNSLVAVGGFMGAQASVLAHAAPQVSAPPVLGYAAQFHEPYSIVGLVVPNWIGVALYVLFLVIGAIFGANQQTAVDGKFTRVFLKPIYSLVFGVAMTLFVMPKVYPDITIWGLIFPALFFAAIGAVVIYFVIAFFTSEKLWSTITDWANASTTEILADIGKRIKNAIKAILGGVRNDSTQFYPGPTGIFWLGLRVGAVPLPNRGLLAYPVRRRLAGPYVAVIDSRGYCGEITAGGRDDTSPRGYFGGALVP